MRKKYFAIFSIVFVGIIACSFTFLVILNAKIVEEKDPIMELESEENKIEDSQENTEKETVVVELPTKQDSHAKISVIGDIMCHNSQYIDAFDNQHGTYDFSYVFDQIKDNIGSADLAIR